MKKLLIGALAVISAYSGIGAMEGPSVGSGGDKGKEKVEEQNLQITSDVIDTRAGLQRPGRLDSIYNGDVSATLSDFNAADNKASKGTNLFSDGNDTTPSKEILISLLKRKEELQKEASQADEAYKEAQKNYRDKRKYYTFAFFSAAAAGAAFGAWWNPKAFAQWFSDKISGIFAYLGSRGAAVFGGAAGLATVYCYRTYHDAYTSYKNAKSTYEQVNRKVSNLNERINRVEKAVHEVPKTTENNESKNSDS